METQLLCYQSSYYPITNRNLDEIKEYSSNSSGSNVRLIHNKYDLRYWKEDQRESNDSDINAVDEAKKKMLVKLKYL